MALFYIILSLLYTSTLGVPYKPFEVYGPPPAGEVAPVHREVFPLTPVQVHTPELLQPVSSQRLKAPFVPIVKPVIQVAPSIQHVPEVPEVDSVPGREVLPEEIPIVVPNVPAHEKSPQTVVPSFEVPPQISYVSPNQPQVVTMRDKSGQYSFGVNQPGPGGQVVKEQGRLITTNDGWEYVIAKKGSYSYTSPEGIPVTVEWEADHNGFRILKSSV